MSKKYFARLSNGELISISESRYNQLSPYYNTHNFKSEGNNFKYSGTSYVDRTSNAKKESNDEWYENHKKSADKWYDDYKKRENSWRTKTKRDNLTEKYLAERKRSEKSLLSSVNYYNNNYVYSAPIKKYERKNSNANSYHTYWRSYMKSKHFL